MPSGFDAIPSFVLILGSFPLFGFAFYKVVGMLIENEIDTIPGVLTLSIIFGMFATIAISRDEVLQWSILLVLATSYSFYPFAAKVLAHNDHRHINKGAIEKHYEAWAARPDNAAAALGLAKALYDHGYRAVGIGLAENTLSRFSRELDVHSMRAPRDMFRQEDILLEKWKRAAGVDLHDKIKCRDCGCMNEPDALQCARCKRPHILELVRAGDSRSQVAGKLAFAFVLVAGTIIGCVALSLRFQGAMQILAIIVGVSAVGGLMAWIFRQPKYDGTVYRPLVSDD